MTEELRSGAMDEEYEAKFGYNAGAVSQRQASRIADAIMEDARLTGGAPSTTPLKSTGRSGVPQGYGKYGDFA
jgi:hypothetical protein